MLQIIIRNQRINKVDCLKIPKNNQTRARKRRFLVQISAPCVCLESGFLFFHIQNCCIFQFAKTL